MKVSAVSSGVSADIERAPVPLEGISREDLLRAYRTMLLSRRLDDTFELDLFSPIRQDWLDHTDDYFQK